MKDQVVQLCRTKRMEGFESQAEGFEFYVVDTGEQVTWGFSVIIAPPPSLLLGDAVMQ